jgi:phosphoglycerate dehydrogenase-like enzyme
MSERQTQSMAGRHRVVFVTDRGKRHQRSALDGAPPELDVMMLRRPTRAALLAQLPEAEFLVTERAPLATPDGHLDAEIIAAGPRLRLIQRLGSLAYDIDLAAARAAGVPVAIWPLPVAQMVAEHMVLQILALSKRLPEVAAVANAAAGWGDGTTDTPARRTNEDTFAYNWSGRTGISTLVGQTVGILGFGEIGAELARRLRGFSAARLLYNKRSRLPAPAEAALGLTYAPQDDLIAASNVLCVLLPYFPETDMLLDAARLATMKPGALLVSCGSGSVIDEAALAAALRGRLPGSRGRLAGAALDTFEWEPLRPENPLLPLARDPAANVLLTPHTAAGGTRSPSDVPPRREEYTNLTRVLTGRRPLHPVE